MASNAENGVGCWLFFDDLPEGAVEAAFIGHTHEEIYSLEMGERGYTVPCQTCRTRQGITLTYDPRLTMLGGDGIIETPREA